MRTLFIMFVGVAAFSVVAYAESNAGEQAKIAYEQRVQRAQERFDKEITKAEEIYRRNLEMALAQAKSSEDTVKIATLEAKLNTLDSDQKNLSDDNRKIRKRISVGQIIKEIPSNYRSKNGKVSTQYIKEIKGWTRGRFEGKEIKLTVGEWKSVRQEGESTSDVYLFGKDNVRGAIMLKHNGGIERSDVGEEVTGAFESIEFAQFQPGGDSYDILVRLRVE